MSEPVKPLFWFECPACKQMRLEVRSDNTVQCVHEEVLEHQSGTRSIASCVIFGEVISHIGDKWRLRLYARPVPLLEFQHRRTA